jgi:Arc/MetJ-type ribon-helix-helix transcriptional regulator
MSERKARVSVTLDPHLVAYAERLVEAGKADSVSAVVNDALEAKSLREREGLGLLRAAAAKADPARVARMRAHVAEQLGRRG